MLILLFLILLHCGLFDMCSYLSLAKFAFRYGDFLQTSFSLEVFLLTLVFDF